MTTSPLANPRPPGSLLEEFGLATKHRLGQNFLKSTIHVIERICPSPSSRAMSACSRLARVAAR